MDGSTCAESAERKPMKKTDAIIAKREEFFYNGLQEEYFESWHFLHTTTYDLTRGGNSWSNQF